MTTDPDTTDPHDAPPPPAPPPAPREVTDVARRRAWGERHVRVWWMLGAAIALIAVYYGATRAYGWNESLRLIRGNERVTAEVMHWEKSGKAGAGMSVPRESSVSLEFTYKGVTRRVFGPLEGRTKEIKMGESVPLFVDPNNPARWTGRTEPGSLALELVAVMILLPVAVVLFALALLARRRVLRVYREGEPVLAEVVSVGHSAAAPLARMVRCAIHVTHDDGREDVRVTRVLVPADRAPHPGHSLWLIAPPDRPDRAIPAALFE